MFRFVRTWVLGFLAVVDVLVICEFLLMCASSCSCSLLIFVSFWVFMGTCICWWGMGFGKWKRTTRGSVIAWGREEERASTELVQPPYTHVACIALVHPYYLNWYNHHTHMYCSGTPITWTATLISHHTFTHAALVVIHPYTANINSYSGILVHWTVALESYSALVQWKSSTAKSVPSLEAV